MKKQPPSPSQEIDLQVLNGDQLGAPLLEVPANDKEHTPRSIRYADGRFIA